MNSRTKSSVQKRRNPMRKLRTILVVDDEPAWLEAMQMVLKEEGYKAVAATSGEEALRRLQRQKPDLIMTDVRMPAMNGFDLYEKIKENPTISTIPVVFMSSIDDYYAKKTAKELGATGYMTKPSFTEDLKKTVEQFLKELPQREP
jgi:CheY-like chemotaxis protein